MTFGASQLVQSQRRNLSPNVLERPSKRTSHASSYGQLGSTGLQGDVFQTAFSQDPIGDDGGSRPNRSTSLLFARPDDNNNIIPNEDGTDSTFGASAFDLGMRLDPTTTSHQLSLAYPGSFHLHLSCPCQTVSSAW